MLLRMWMRIFNEISRLAWNPLTSKYGSRLLLRRSLYCLLFRIWFASLSYYSNKLLSTKQRSAFVCFANLLVFLANDSCLRDYDLVVAHC